MNITKYLCLFLLVLPLYSQTDSSNQINCSCNCIYGPSDILPDSFYLAPDFPHPFAARTYADFGISKSSMVGFKIFDVYDNVIKETDFCFLAPGCYRFDWGSLFGDWSGVSSGVYWIKMKVLSASSIDPMFEGEKKVIIVK